LLRHAADGDRPQPGTGWNHGLPSITTRGSINPVNQESEPGRVGPPHNPGLRELIAGKRQWAKSQAEQRADAKRGFCGWHERGYLPHRDEPGLTQFVTCHLAESFPANLRSEWAELLQVEDERERHRQLQTYLDQGRGACHLRKPELALLVDEAFRFYHGRNYVLCAWVVMPNHVHVLFRVEGTPLSRIIQQIKEYTARIANKVLKREGRFWAEDYWDTYMRDAEHELQTRRYIENNPVKAGLVAAASDWAWSSARYRDQNGALHL
jgi:putative transposase